MKKRFMAPVLALLVAVMFLIPSSALAQNVHIAVAANFTNPVQELVAAYKASVDSTFTASYKFASTGVLAGEIRDTANNPYDLFFAADDTTPDALYREGLVTSPVDYVRGVLVAWSNTKDITDADVAIGTANGRGALAANSVAIANPADAPYGLAACQFLSTVGMATIVETNNVKTVTWVDAAIKHPIDTYNNIGNCYNAVNAGTVPYGFVGKSQVYYAPNWAGESYWEVPLSSYDPIMQAACLVYKSGATNAKAQAFMNWVLTDTDDALPILQRYGYISATVTP